MATAVTGTLDLLSAFLFGGLAGRTPAQILRYVASGALGDRMNAGGTASALAGLVVHFALMALIVGAYAATAAQGAALRRRWAGAGTLWGVLVYLVMYWIVIQARFGVHPRTDAWSIGTALFSHIVCVGLPIAFILSGGGKVRSYGPA